MYAIGASDWVEHSQDGNIKRYREVLANTACQSSIRELSVSLRKQVKEAVGVAVTLRLLAGDQWLV
jgi:hypothetical protein